MEFAKDPTSSGVRSNPADEDELEIDIEGVDYDPNWNGN
jgi:hypothetical protein